MAKAIPPKFVPQAGAQIAFQGTVSSYTPNPFMMTMTDGVLLDKSGNPIVTAASGAQGTGQEASNRNSASQLTGAFGLPFFRTVCGKYAYNLRKNSLRTTF